MNSRIHLKQLDEKTVALRIPKNHPVNVWGETVEFNFSRFQYHPGHGENTIDELRLHVGVPRRKKKFFRRRLTVRTPFFVDSMNLEIPLIEQVRNSYVYLNSHVIFGDYENDWAAFHDKVRKEVNASKHYP